MQISKKQHNHLLIVLISFFFSASLILCSPPSFCGKIPLQAPFLDQNSTSTSQLKRMILCKSQKLYFRTSLGLFPISSIDYEAKLLTISHHSCSSSFHYISPLLLSSSFPSPPQPNSLLLFNCSHKGHDLLSPLIQNCTHFKACGLASSRAREQETKGAYSCLYIDDLRKLEGGFDPKDFNCSHYRRVYRYRSSSAEEGQSKGYELGTRISFDIPDHVPNICEECEKPNGNCGVGLRCICHPKDCKDKVVSISRSINPISNVLFTLLCFISLVVLA